MLRFGLSELVIAKINAVLAHYPQVLEARLYGSRAKGNFHASSDIDLTFIGDQLTRQHLLRIESDIDELSLPYKIDLSLFHQIDNSELIGHIERVGMTFYKNQNP
jgi:predicted nucleotidyltransferase